MPYKSQSQRAFFHTDTAKAKGIDAKTVAEYDTASKGMKLPRKLGKGRKMSGGRR